MSRARRLRSILGWLLVLDLVLLAWPRSLGGHLGLVIVAGHSMDGTYRTGDLLLTWPQHRYGRGDVVVYRVPGDGAGAGLRVVHRVVGGDPRTGFTTKGDNREYADIWHPTPADIDGRPFFRVPAGGVVLRLFLNPLALALFCAVCVFLAIAGTDRSGSRADGLPASPDDADTETERPELAGVA
jgi:signal peptidase